MVVTTCGSAQICQRFNFQPDVIAIDETLYALSELSFTSAKCVMLVGDTKQLSPYLISTGRSANRLGMSAVEVVQVH